MNQAMKALTAANELRLHRAEVKRRIAAGELTVMEALEDPLVIRPTKEGNGGMRLGELLLAQNQWGHTRMTAFLRRYMPHTTPSRPVSTLTERELGILARALDQWGKRGRYMNALQRARAGFDTRSHPMIP